jgi:hypothetical protein
MEMIRKIFYGFILVLLLVSQVAADYPVGTNQTIANASVDSFSLIPFTATDLAYPQDLFYTLLVAALVCSAVAVYFLASSNGIPVKALIFVSTAGFVLFMVCAFMSPLSAKFTIVVTSTQIINVATYVFSPWVMYLMYGLAMIMFVLMWYGVLLWYKMLAKDKEQMEHEQFGDLI